MSPNGDQPEWDVPADIDGDDWLAELEAMRAVGGQGNRTLYTREQDMALVVARLNDPPVPWEKLCAWWRARDWRGSSDTTLRRRVVWLLKPENKDYLEGLREDIESKNSKR